VIISAVFRQLSQLEHHQIGRLHKLLQLQQIEQDEPHMRMKPRIHLDKL
tara:strand:+ start:307 stop:453 length:147 start_codon:yes stop_codon:yes gene_type:complete